jgi:ABC-type sulfate transport system permease component
MPGRRQRTDAVGGGISTSATRNSQRTWNHGLASLILTLKLDLVVCALLVLVGVPLAFWLAFWQWRWKFLVEAVVALLVLPRRFSAFTSCSRWAAAPSENL